MASKSKTSEPIVTPPSAQHKVFVSEYVKHGNRKRAAMEAGVSEGSAEQMAARWLNPGKYPLVAKMAEDLLKAKEQKALLDADDSLRFVQTLMTFAPVDYFDCGPGGGWYITQEDVRKLPDWVKGLIERLELTQYEDAEGNLVCKLKVEIMSKTTAMAINSKVRSTTSTH
jgi:hypothetical protein